MSLTFNPNTHRYRLDKKAVPGVTTIIGVLDKPGLRKWAASSVAEYVADHKEAVEHLYAAGRGPMVAALKETPWQKRDDAADRGTQLHDFAERLLKGEEVDVPDDLAPVVENALAFLDEWKIDPILIEQAVGSREHWYAGTLDVVARYVNPVTSESGVGIFDWKSGRKVYASCCFQLNAYGHAEFHGLDGDENPLPIIDSAFGVHINADDYEVNPLPYSDEVFAEFLTIRQAYQINKRAEGDWRKPGSGYVGLPIRKTTDPWEQSA